MKKTMLIIVCIKVLILCIFLTSCTPVEESNVSETEESISEIILSEESSCTEEILVEDNSSTEEVLIEESESESIEEGSSDEISIETETVSFWELMNASEELEDEEQEMLQRFYPIFCEQKTFSMVDSLWDESDSPVNIIFDEICKVIVPYEYENGYTELKYLEKFTLVDMTGDGKVELVLYVRDLGWNVIVFEENNGEFTAASFGYRSMSPIYSNGMHRGSGGAGYYGYYRMHFEEGYLVKETVANHDWDYDENGEIVIEAQINGQSVSAEEFYTWESENTQEEAKWNYVETTELDWEMYE